MHIRGLVGAGLLGMAWTTTALADERSAQDTRKVEYSASLLVGYGAGENFEDDTRNDYGFALGGRAGLTLPTPRLYFGLSLLHFTGYEDASQKVHTNTLDGEVGYEFQLLQKRLLIRPQLALGAAMPVVLQSDNAGAKLVFHWAPGALVGLRVGPALISAEYRRDMTPGDWPSSNSVLFGCGVRL